jgi:hypothetical protein
MLSYLHLQQYTDETNDKERPQAKLTSLAEPSESDVRVFLSRNKAAQTIMEEKLSEIKSKLNEEAEKSKYLESKVVQLQEELGRVLAASAPSMSDQISKLTKMEILELLNTNENAKAVIAELTKGANASSAPTVSENAQATAATAAGEPPIRGQGDMQPKKQETPDANPLLDKLTISEHLQQLAKNPQVEAAFLETCLEALNNHRMLCRESYMAALRAVERDVKAWVLFHQTKHFKKTGQMLSDADLGIGMSPAARELQNPTDVPERKLNPNFMEAVKETAADAAKAKEKLVSACKRKLEEDVDVAMDSVS